MQQGHGNGSCFKKKCISYHQFSKRLKVQIYSGLVPTHQMETLKWNQTCM